MEYEVYCPSCGQNLGHYDKRNIAYVVGRAHEMRCDGQWAIEIQEFASERDLILKEIIDSERNESDAYLLKLINNLANEN
jgi:hypothetical protein